MLECTKCGASISEEDLKYAEEHDGRFPEDENCNTFHMDDCGCRGQTEDLGDACMCNFVKEKPPINIEGR